MVTHVVYMTWFCFLNKIKWYAKSRIRLTCIELFEICTHKIDRVYVHTTHRFYVLEISEDFYNSRIRIAVYGQIFQTKVMSRSPFLDSEWNEPILIYCSQQKKKMSQTTFISITNEIFDEIRYFKSFWLHEILI